MEITDEIIDNLAVWQSKKVSKNQELNAILRAYIRDALDSMIFNF